VDMPYDRFEVPGLRHSAFRTTQPGSSFPAESDAGDYSRVRNCLASLVERRCIELGVGKLELRVRGLAGQFCCICGRAFEGRWQGLHRMFTGEHPSHSYHA